MQDNTGTLTVRGALTKLGRQRSAEGNLNITKFAVSSDGVNFGLANENLTDPLLAIKRTPLFDVWKDGPSVQYKMIPRFRISNFDPSFQFPIGVTRQTNLAPVSILGIEEARPYPYYLNENGRKEMIFYGTSQRELKRVQTVTVNFVPNDMYFMTSNAVKFITVILHDTRYFDIALSDQQRNMIQTENVQTAGGRNNGQANSLGLDSPVDLPKYLNVAIRRITTTTETPAKFSFDLRYRGNYIYRNPEFNKYETLLTFLSEDTGNMEHVRLVVSPELPKN
jgi:hypothetical protein